MSKPKKPTAQGHWPTEYALKLHADFDKEVDSLPGAVRIQLFFKAKVLRMNGPNLGRPIVDTLIDSKHSNMKELRFDADNGVWRVAFAFDPERRIILLAAGNKSGISESLFYRRLIKTADERFDEHIAGLEKDVNHEQDRKKTQQRTR